MSTERPPILRAFARLPRGLLAVVWAALAIAVPQYARAMEEPRTWTDVQGRGIKATFLSLKDGKVQLKLENGSLSAVALERLSPADRQYAIDRSKNQPSAPPPRTTDAVAGTNATWPTEIAISGIPEVTTIKEDSQTEEFIYESENYEFRCDAKLGAAVVREFARIFEATVLLNAKLPLDFKPEPEEGRSKYLALLFKEKSDYYAAGATPGSSGIYMSSQSCLMMPLESLGVRAVGKRFALDREAQNFTLIHEITHQSMSRWLMKLPTWYTEGSAEYVCAAKYRNGRFSLSRMGDNVVEYLRQSRGVREKRWTMWHLHHLMQFEPESWAAALSVSDSVIPNRNYASVAILTFYYYHLDGDGDGRHIIQYINDIRAGTLERLAAQRNLIRGRAYGDIETDLSKKMRRYGLDLEFTGNAEPAPESSNQDDDQGAAR